MKKFLLGSVGLVAMLAGPAAMAADMRLPPPPPPVVYYDWTGAYIGFNAGGVWNDVTRVFNGPSNGVIGNGVGNTRTNDSDGIFGFHAGAQWQWGAWVLGAEAALSGCFRECRSTSGVLQTPTFTPNTFGEHKITNLFTVGPRLGYAWDRLMIFATGGWAAGQLTDAPCSSPTHLRTRRLGVGQSQERPLFIHHQSLRRPRVDRQRRVAQQRVVCGRRLRLHGA